MNLSAYNQHGWPGKQLMELRYLRDKLARELRAEAQWYEDKDGEPLVKWVDAIVDQSWPDKGKQELLQRFDPDFDGSTTGCLVLLLVKLSREIGRRERKEYEALMERRTLRERSEREEAFAA